MTVQNEQCFSTITSKVNLLTLGNTHFNGIHFRIWTLTTKPEPSVTISEAPVIHKACFSCVPHDSFRSRQKRWLKTAQTEQGWRIRFWLRIIALISLATLFSTGTLLVCGRNSKPYKYLISDLFKPSLNLNLPLVFVTVLPWPLSRLIVDGDDISFCSQDAFRSCLCSSGPKWWPSTIRLLSFGIRTSERRVFSSLKKYEHDTC